MRKRNPGASTTSTRQVPVTQKVQQQPQQPPYGYPPLPPQQMYPPQGMVNQGYPPQGYPQTPQVQQGINRQQSVHQRPTQPQHMNELNDGNPPVIHHGKISMKDAVTLITLRLAKLEEMTSTPTFNSLMNGEVSGDSIRDISTDIVDNIGERLSTLESNLASIFEELAGLKSTIDVLVSQSCIDEEQETLFILPPISTILNGGSVSETTEQQPVTDDDQNAEEN